MIIVNEKVKIFGKICLKEESNSQLRDPNADVLTTQQLNSIFVFFIITRIFHFIRINFWLWQFKLTIIGWFLVEGLPVQSF